MAYFLKYNNIIVSDFAGFGTVAAEMPPVPEHDLITKTINGRNGDLFFYGRDKGREITLTFNVRTTNAEDYSQIKKHYMQSIACRLAAFFHLYLNERKVNVGGDDM